MRLRRVPSFFFVCALAALAGSASLEAQSPDPRPADVATPQAIVDATYAAVSRAPGNAYDWDRFRSLFLPAARLIPNLEQTGGELRVLTVEEFIAWVDPLTRVGGPDDRGWAETGIASRIDRYGDVAQVFSTYQKQYGDAAENLGRGINSFQLIWNAGRWWIVGIAWDEETSGIAIPAEYLP